MIIAGCNPRIADAFRQHEDFSLSSIPPQNETVDGFDPPAVAGGQYPPIPATSGFHPPPSSMMVVKFCPPVMTGPSFTCVAD